MYREDFTCEDVDSCDNCYLNLPNYKYDIDLNRCVEMFDYKDEKFDVDEILNEVNTMQCREEW